ncbi:5'-phosphoribosylformyl glycinamidine synthetase [Spathaspora passalidarum NRRL Y-27907]|uniref:Phosphoribosylformylglycinamidine synthase n=1 Tax=Spathaspora passalidarum (strain NRRL Y-27907 / 11-Y1) TaxID=619300 RepID=G3AHK0_SPAPN|nr:5'-phosphoribosylformyl glycinamidine synthetase [Spathaspora passalidarum NRRL Y-27907]EGW34164.1 5'-phosphoribosylformyl glycinamidine synthetase [Spathaspora passalidarum NRRL Y-27907]
MSNFLILPGPKALSSFRVNNFIQEIEKKVNQTGAIEAVATSYTHYVSLKQQLSDKQLQLLKILLTYDTPTDAENKLSQQLVKYSTISGDEDTSAIQLDDTTYLVQVLPRPGTISPWSSKATDIAQICGLSDQIERIERGLSLIIKTKPGFNLGQFLTAGGEILTSVFDRMTQTLYLGANAPKYNDLFAHHSPKPLVTVDIISNKENLNKANKELGLALDSGEIQYLINAFTEVIGRNPTDVELFMFAQVNSEHCRHKIFNADWTIDNVKKDLSLFKMIRNTHQKNPLYTISAYSDNAAVFEGPEGYVFAPDFNTKQWKSIREKVHTLVKVETHNHPTAVSPFAGAATGSGGEIRDEGAVGRGSKSKAGLAGFSVADLNIPTLPQPWERNVGKPNHIASSLDIMIEAPIGSAAFNNEFGRPAINGYFRTLTTEVENSKGETEIRGFHKPIMLAGGMGAIRPDLALKNVKITPGAKLIVLGGQSMLIGLGGGAASSISSGEGSADLDFASVQRGNPEIQRRAQQVIDACVSLGKDGNPIQSIHDVGAGGLSNALPELVHDNDLGAKFELRSILSLEPGMSPMEIWCNESQERYVLGVAPENLELFAGICERERAPFAVVGEATEEQRLILTDSLLKTTPIDLEMSVLFGKPPKMSRTAITQNLNLKPFSTNDLDVSESISRVLQLPSVGSKNFLITIGDRFITGLVDRDQMVGPWQVPVADVGVTATSLGETVLATGEAMAMGEKPTLALISASSSAKMCVAESLLNIFAADIPSLGHVKLSANWMSAASHDGEGAKLYEAVQAIGLDLCPDLGISIPVGKDSMSMKMKWDDKEVTAPLALTITSFAPVDNTSNTWTPYLQPVEDSVLVLVDLAAKVKKALGGSALAQVYKQVGDAAPTVHSHQILKSFLQTLVVLHKKFDVLAYHDRSEGGLITTAVEMAFASRSGLDLTIQGEDLFTELFNEELGAVFQIRSSEYEQFKEIFATNGISSEYISTIGKPNFQAQTVNVAFNGQQVYESTRGHLQQLWSNTSYHIQKLRDNPETSTQEYQAISDDKDPGLSYQLTFNPSEAKEFSRKPKVAILREQGVNSQQEMAWSFQQAGFDVYDVTMTDILENRVSLDDFVGLAACGGFSYGDVLGAGAGWAKSVLFHEKTRNEFKKFFQDRTDTFAFGACNGCQFFSRIAELIPGTENWPTFERNLSEQYEARFVMVEVEASEKNNSIFLQKMKGSKLPIAVAHGEGRAQFKSSETQARFHSDVINYVDNYGKVTEQYPFNPNGSPNGIAGISNANGRVLAMMPHPERVTRKESNSYYPVEQGKQWGVHGPWIQLFRSAREWVGDNF